MRFLRIALASVALSGLLASPVRAYSSEEHKILVDMAAAQLRLDPSIVLPAPTRFGPVNRDSLLKIHRDAKYLAVGYTSNNSNDYSEDRGNVQDNCFWTDYLQRAYNFKDYIPAPTELSNLVLRVTGVVGGYHYPFTIGELAAIYGDYRRTTYCETGSCYLTNDGTSKLGFDGNVKVYEDFYCPDSLAVYWYVKYIANGLCPPFKRTAYSAFDDEYTDAGWWGDEMLRTAYINDWHFGTGAIAWYVGMHRLALHYVNLARVDRRYWNHALHYEASALHSFTDLFALGHVVTSRDETTYGILTEGRHWDSAEYAWMRNVTRMGGGERDAQGRILLTPDLPRIADASPRRIDFLDIHGEGWSLWALQESDFHDAFNGGGGIVRNLKGDRFMIFGDADFWRTSFATRQVIVEGVRASLQSLFDAYVELGQGRTVDEIGAAGSPYFTALRSLPVFIESNPEYTYTDHEVPAKTRHLGNNFWHVWTRYAHAVDAIAGTEIVPDGSTSPCTAQYLYGGIEFTDLTAGPNPCPDFPNQGGTSPPPPPVPMAMGQSFPNPFGEAALIRFALPSADHARVEVLDLHGSRVATIVDEQRPAGPNVASWDGTTESGQRAPSGLYYYRLTVYGRSLTRKLTLIR